jgi:hypothetical protein
MGEPSLPEPRPVLSPEDVVLTQLDALKHNDTPYEDAGIETAWRFASPANRANTGPLAAFTRMVRNDAYRPMIDHREATLGPVGRRGSTATAEVAVTGPDGHNRSYRFRLSSDHRGELEGCWLTDAVLVV